jgi:hypothetical protein
MPGGTQVVSRLIEGAFGAARSSYVELDNAWISLSMRLAGPTLNAAASYKIQRAGAIDLLVRCLEDDLKERRLIASYLQQVDFAFHYQKMLSEMWVASCYEILRAIRQREMDARERGQRTSQWSLAENFISLLFDLERLRMPLEKYEIAKDKSLKEPLTFTRFPATGDASDLTIYDSQDPDRIHIMPTGLSDWGSVMWLAFDHAANREYWIDRRQLSDRLLALVSDESH